MTYVAERPLKLLPGRFAYLMGLYAENYQRLARIFSPQRLSPGTYFSSIEDGLDIRLDLIEQHRYTVELRLNYCFIDSATGELSPSAWLRMYQDAHLAEATHCHPGRHLIDVLGPYPAAHTVLQHRLRMNAFLTRWLEYLAEQGHSMATLRRAGSDTPIALLPPIDVTVR
ncbi:DUF1249 domain-containing protein [Tahibacter amnicola]|uniref:DUF1249 domain-containing protein n=1 Tax=Tahibacter amnicola TaxID=2976241 RepID=A0ABY6BLW3_9GAMM|nr:DUF1249 domain-containing protein [Tahibacter amnicola]UXI70040.1 DUF1249 domain-containing protein [Tahibacter amnicola]